MVSDRSDTLGRLSIEVELVNNNDLVRAKAGDIPNEAVRRTTLRGIVDSGATRLVIPEAVARQLGLDSVAQTTVRYADGRSGRRELAGNIHLSALGRSGLFDAIVEPGLDSALIGAIVLEVLDLIVDCTRQTLAPRDPNVIISEAE